MTDFRCVFRFSLFIIIILYYFYFFFFCILSFLFVSTSFYVRFHSAAAVFNELLRVPPRWLRPCARSRYVPLPMFVPSATNGYNHYYTNPESRPQSQLMVASVRSSCPIGYCVLTKIQYNPPLSTLIPWLSMGTPRRR